MLSNRIDRMNLQCRRDVLMYQLFNYISCSIKQNNSKNKIQKHMIQTQKKLLLENLSKENYWVSSDLNYALIETNK